MSKQPFAEFLEAHHQATAAALREELGECAFLIVRERGAPPQIVTLQRAGGTIGSGPESACVVQGLVATHCRVRHHTGLSSWILVAFEQTGVNGALAPQDRPLLLSSRDKLRFPTSQVRIEFYRSEELIERLKEGDAGPAPD